MRLFEHILRRQLIRKFSSKADFKVVPSKEVLDDIGNSLYKPRYHPGTIKTKCVSLPSYIVDAVEKAVKDYPIRSLIVESEAFRRKLKGKSTPIENVEKNELQKRLVSNILSKTTVEINTELDEERLKQSVNDKLQVLMKKRVYNWSTINYDSYNSLLYLFANAASDYAVLTKIFTEIYNRDKDFKPRSLFDFGSGIGTVTWAATQFWKKDIFEYFNVDISRDMNDLAEVLLKGGTGIGNMSLKGVFYRQFLPASNVMYDLVVSAYTLMELPSFSARIQTILNLWNKTQNYLVIVENGTNAGFNVINEIRDYILQNQNKNSVGHMFSPCPHEMACPRFLAADKLPCNFQVNYSSLPIGQKIMTRKETYSYLVLKKGPRKEKEWPRIVREVLVRPKHSICRMCTSNGQLQEVIFTASKHGKTMYHCARSSKWGDRLPIYLEDVKE